jgi:deoxyribose-phosphate aldolase
MIVRNVKYDRKKLAGMIDQSLLVPDATKRDVMDRCAAARQFVFRSVCINPSWAPLVATELEGTGIETCFVIGFPLGATSTVSKVHEVAETLKALQGRPGAIDMVTNIGLLKDEDYKAYTHDIAEVVKVGRDAMVGVKAILETAMLTDDEIRAACGCAAEAGVEFVKTSTGRGGSPNIRHVAVMRNAAPENVGVKFSGFGNCSAAELAIMGIVAGANRLGTPIGPQIIEEIETHYRELVINEPQHRNA